jgi:hypothetical protein
VRADVSVPDRPVPGRADERDTQLDAPASAHHAKRDRAADADIRDQPVDHRHVADVVPLAETRMSLEAGLALELPEQSPCGYDELSTPGAWATGDVLLTSATLTFVSWNRLGAWLRQIDMLRNVA